MMSASFLFSESFLSAANPFLLQGELISAFALGMGIIFESERYKGTDAKDIGFWLVIIGVIFETVFSFALFASETHITSLQRGTIKAQQERIIGLDTGLKTAEMHIPDRQLTESDRRRFRFDITPSGPEIGLHILYPTDDGEAARFAGDIASWVPGWTVRIDAIPEGQPYVFNADNWPKAMPMHGPIPHGITGPFDADRGDKRLKSAEISLFMMLRVGGFCIKQGGDATLVDTDPHTMTLLVGPKDRNAPDCK